MEEKKKQLEELDKKLTAESAKLETLLKVKEEAEAPEREAKDKYDQMIKELKEKHANEVMIKKSEEAFKEIDSDSSGGVSFEELIACTSIDGPNQCGVSETEVKEWFPIDLTSLDIDGFREFIWKEKLDKHFKTAAEKQQETLDGQKIEEESHKDEFDDSKTNEDENEDDSDYDFPEDHPKHPDNVAKLKDLPKDVEVPPMSDEAQKLIDVANEARAKFKDQEKVKQDLENQKNDIERDVELDVGPEKEFLHLVKQCFDYKEKEYTYTFCAFDRGAQKPKSGSETNLGRWGEWSGPAHNKYSQMKLTRGQRCWNGPDRSLTINFECGQEDKILSTSEPSMCEYVMQFSTPAACNKQYDFDHERRVHEDL